MKRILVFLLTLILILSMVGCKDKALDFEVNKSPSDLETPDMEETEDNFEDKYYTTMEDVGLYIHIYEKLPSNFITKKEAVDLGWESNKGNLWQVTDNKSIGGDKFGNREGLLPKLKGRQYFECDINYQGGYRGAERIVYSNDGLIYYTNDHYKSFNLLYGDE